VKIGPPIAPRPLPTSPPVDLSLAKEDSDISLILEVPSPCGRLMDVDGRMLGREPMENNLVALQHMKALSATK
jgi:hypothetical protein